MASHIIELLHTLDVSSGHSDHNESLKSYIESCCEHGAFNSKSATDVAVKTINSYLNQPFHREKGLLLLLAFVPRSSIEALSSNAISWMLNCIKIINQTGSVSKSLALKVLAGLIKVTVKFPEVHKECAKEVVPKFLLDCVRRKSCLQIPAAELLECVQVSLKCYSGPAGEFKIDILKLLLSLVESKTDVICAAAQCIPLVAQLGGGGKQGNSHKITWQKQQLALVNVLHSLLNNMYEHITVPLDIEMTDNDSQYCPEPVTEKDIFLKTQRLAKQFISVSYFLEAMLLNEFPVAKLVAPDRILDLISFTQKPTQLSLGTSREALYVVSVLPCILTSSLRLLESLVLCLGRNLVPQGALVTYLCSQVVYLCSHMVVWTQQQHPGWPYALEKPYRRTRFAAYCCLYSWLSVGGANSQVETILDKLLPTMLADIYALKPTVKLKIGSKTNRNRKKQPMLENIEDRSEKLQDNTANHRLCEQVLKVLTLLVQNACSSLKLEDYTAITETVLVLVGELPVPYSDVDCLCALYQLLLTLCLEPHPDVSPPLAAALATFTENLHHPASQVRTICLKAISSLEKIIHPTAATLYFPLQQDKQNSREREWDEDNEGGHEAKKRKTNEQNADFINIEKSVNEDGSSNDTLASKPIEIVIEEESDVSVEVLEMSPLQAMFDIAEEKSYSSSEATITAKKYSENRIKDHTFCENNISKDDCSKEEIHSTNLCYVKDTNKSDNVANEDETQENGDAKTNICLANVTNDNTDNLSNNQTDTFKNFATDVSEMLVDFKDEVDNVET